MFYRNQIGALLQKHIVYIAFLYFVCWKKQRTKEHGTRCRIGNYRKAYCFSFAIAIIFNIDTASPLSACIQDNFPKKSFGKNRCQSLILFVTFSKFILLFFFLNEPLNDDSFLNFGITSSNAYEVYLKHEMNWKRWKQKKIR